MSLIQINLYTNNYNKYKELYIEINNNISLHNLFLNIHKNIKNNEKIEIITNKLVIDDNIYFIENQEMNFETFLNDNDIKINDNSNIICFINFKLPKLIKNDFLNDLYKKYINN